MTASHIVVLLGSLVAALVFMFALMAAGARLRALARVPLCADLKAPCDFLAGCWLYALLALAAGVAGFFTGPVLMGLAAALCAGGRWRRAGWRLRESIWPGLACALLLPVALAPPFFYDALVYHLALPWQSLVEGRVTARAEDLFATFPPLAQLLFAAPVSAGLDRAAALLHLASFVMAGAAASALARRLGAPRGWANFGGALLPLLPAVVLVPGLPAAEGFAVGGILAAFAIATGDAGSSRAVAAAARPSPRRRRAALAAASAAGVLAGISTAARLQGLQWTVILLAVVLFGPAPRGRRWLCAVAGWIAGSAPWWLKNLFLIGAPLAPLGWRRPGIETLWRDSGAQMYLASGAADLLPALWSAVRPHLAYVGPLLLAALFAVVATRSRRAGVILLAAGLGTLSWCLTGSLPRFWAPALAFLLALASAAAGSRAGRWAAGLALGCAAVVGVTFTVREIAHLGSLRLVLAAPDAALRSLVVNSPLPAFEAAAALPPEKLPRDARVLFVAEARSYRFPRRCIVPSQHDVSPLRDLIETSGDAVAVREALLARGITHLLVNRAEMARLARGYPVLPWTTPEGQARFQALLERCGPPVVKEGETAIFALR